MARIYRLVLLLGARGRNVRINVQSANNTVHCCVTRSLHLLRSHCSKQCPEVSLLSIRRCVTIRQGYFLPFRVSLSLSLSLCPIFQSAIINSRDSLSLSTHESYLSGFKSSFIARICPNDDNLRLATRQISIHYSVCQFYARFIGLAVINGGMRQVFVQISCALVLPHYIYES